MIILVVASYFCENGDHDDRCMEGNGMKWNKKGVDNWITG